MADTCTIRTRKFLANRLLNRKQFIVDVIHPNLANLSKTDIAQKVAKLYKVKDASLVVVFGFKTAFGGGRSTGFGIIYDDVDSMRKFEPKHRLIRAGMAKKAVVTRKQKKERKRREGKMLGTHKKGDKKKKVAEE